VNTIPHISQSITYKIRNFPPHQQIDTPTSTPPKTSTPISLGSQSNKDGMYSNFITPLEHIAFSEIFSLLKSPLALSQILYIVQFHTFKMH
jgi:hypothetical protein